MNKDKRILLILCLVGVALSLYCPLVFAQGREYERIRSGNIPAQQDIYSRSQSTPYFNRQAYVNSQAVSDVRNTAPASGISVGKSIGYSLAEEFPEGGEYRLGVSDAMEVFVWQNPDLSRTIGVGPDGYISYPLVGRIRVVGMTPKELEDKMREELAKYVKSPQVSVMITKYSLPVKKIILLGGVKGPGVYKYTGTMSLLQAIALAGDFSFDARSSKVIIVRGNYTQKPQVMQIDVAKLVRKGTGRKDVLLQSLDVVYVPKTAIRVGDKIMILGEVSYPGVFFYQEDMKLVEALLLAGDVLSSARSDSVMLIRNHDKPNRKVMRINYRRMLRSGEMDQNVRIKPNDIIYVPKSFVNDFEIFFKNIKTVIDSFLYLVDVRDQIRVLSGHK